MADGMARGDYGEASALKIRLNLDHLPPSVNAIWRFTKAGKMYRTKDYMTWRDAETFNVLGQMRGRPTSQRGFTGPVFITVAMRRPRANSDLDNRAKGILDLLAHVGVIANDKDVMGLNMFWSFDLPHGVAAEISIVAADAQEQAA